MKYKGQVGELKWWAFMCSIFVSLAIALLVYRRLEIVTVSEKPEQTGASELLKKEKDLEAEVANLKARMLQLELHCDHPCEKPKRK